MALNLKDVTDFFGEFCKLPFLLFTYKTKNGNGSNNGSQYKDLALKVAGALIMFLLAWGMTDMLKKIDDVRSSNAKQWERIAAINEKLAENCTEIKHLGLRTEKLENKLDKK